MGDKQPTEDGWLWEHNAPARAWNQKLKDGICPTCNEPMTQDVQGGTVYALPCQHVLYFFHRARLALEYGPEPKEASEKGASDGE